jgi:hypothetical protein
MMAMPVALLIHFICTYQLPSVQKAKVRELTIEGQKRHEHDHDHDCSRRYLKMFGSSPQKSHLKSEVWKRDD